MATSADTAITDLTFLLIKAILQNLKSYPVVFWVINCATYSVFLLLFICNYFAITFLICREQQNHSHDCCRHERCIHETYASVGQEVYN